MTALKLLYFCVPTTICYNDFMKLRNAHTNAPNDRTYFDNFFFDAIYLSRLKEKIWSDDFFTDFEIEKYPIVVGDDYYINKIEASSVITSTPYLLSNNFTRFPYEYMRGKWTENGWEKHYYSGWVYVEFTIDDSITNDNEEYAKFKEKDGAIFRVELNINFDWAQYAPEPNKHKILAKEALKGLNSFSSVEFFNYHNSKGECVVFSGTHFFEAHEGNENLESIFYELLQKIRNDIFGDSLKPLFEYLVWVRSNV